MLVQALSIGHAVPRMQFDALVHSVFASAVNLQPFDSPHLLTLLASTQGDLPQGIRLAPAASARFSALQPGMRAACRDGVLRFDGDALAIDLQKAACWDSSLPDLEAHMGQSATRLAWTSTWNTLNDRQAARLSEMHANSLLGELPKGTSAWVQRAGRCMRLLVLATTRFDAASIFIVQELIGLGPGLTPAGDDLVAGYLLGLRYAAGGKPERLGFLAELAKVVLGMLHRTGDISATYLYHAARAEPPRALFELAGAVCLQAAEQTVIESAEAAMAPGHTSGMDAVTGLLIGLAAWDAPELCV